MEDRRSKPSDESKCFYARWQPALNVFFQRRLSNRGEAEDLTQETLARVVANGSFEERSDGYIFQIAQNLLIDRARRQKVRNDYSVETGRTSGREVDLFDPARILEAQEQVAMLMTALGSLPERTQAIFILYRLDNMSQQQIADIFGVSSSTVKQQVAKAMGTLAKKMRNPK